MYSKEQLLGAIQHEFRILKHLWTKVTAENQDHRVAEWTRSAAELMQYLAFETPAQINLMADGGWNQDTYKAWQAKGEGFTIDQFATALDAGYEYIATTINGLSDEQLAESFEMRGMNNTRAGYLVSYFLVFLGAYKQQLFLILKSSGLSRLGTYNLWWWIDAPEAA